MLMQNSGLSGCNLCLVHSGGNGRVTETDHRLLPSLTHCPRVRPSFPSIASRSTISGIDISLGHRENDLHGIAKGGPHGTLFAQARRSRSSKFQTLRSDAPERNGGGRGIRTPGTLSGTSVFKTDCFNRSHIPPRLRRVYQVARGVGRVTSDARARCL